MNDAPKLNGYTFTHPPKPATVFWEAQMITHKLSDGPTVVYNKGFLLKGRLEWGSDGWLEQVDYSGLSDMYNQLTATAKYYPRPDTDPTRCFNVHLTNDFNFVPHGGLLAGRQLYEGVVEFESSIGELTAIAKEIF